MMPCSKPIMTPQFLQDLVRHTDKKEDKLLGTLDHLKYVKKSMLDYRDPLYGETAMHAALDNGMLEILKMFVELDGNFDICNHSSKSTLQLIKERLSLESHLKLREVLEQVEMHQALREVDNLGQVWKVQPMHSAVDQLKPTKVAVYSFLGGAWGTCDENNQSVIDKMLCCIDEGKIRLEDCSKFTIRQILRATDQQGQIWVHAAIKQDKTNALRSFISLGSDVNYRDSVNGKAPLHYAATNDQQEAITILIDGKASVDLSDTRKRTPLHLASFKGSLGSVKLLLQAGANVDLRDLSGQSPLHFATEAGHLDVIRTLLEAGADPNVQDADGNTPLHKSAQKAKFDCLEALLDHNGSVCKIKNFKGQYPSQLLSESLLSNSEEGKSCLEILLQTESKQ